MTFVCEHWEPLASLLLSMVAIGIAIWSSRQTSKEATRQVNAIMDLCILQNSTTLDMLELELYKYSLGRVTDNAELRALMDEMRNLQQEWNTDPKEINRLQHKMRALSNNAEIKKSFEYKIMMRQFALLRGIENLKRRKV